MTTRPKTETEAFHGTARVQQNQQATDWRAGVEHRYEELIQAGHPRYPTTDSTRVRNAWLELQTYERRVRDEAQRFLSERTVDPKNPTFRKTNVDEIDRRLRQIDPHDACEASAISQLMFYKGIVDRLAHELKATYRALTRSRTVRVAPPLLHKVCDSRREHYTCTTCHVPLLYQESVRHLVDEHAMPIAVAERMTQQAWEQPLTNSIR